ncbi:uncharacterized protein LOC120121166 [Hibiscus syriacus]|uniref:uncharacterized protein LOC120121166 n=1 Tax=Hibiscus syriacus TaxID=106335 RepID=UPI00192253A9|nr:uncharacterized protein LOC120121166 [Hibiscus syriacus]
MENNYILEITLISAQGLKKTSKFRRMKTYALAWTDSAVKVRTCIDRVGGVNPTWNDKFLFRVSSEFLYRETSGISIEIFTVGIFSDTLVGTVRLLVSNLLRIGSSYIPVRVPSFSAVHVRRPSGRFEGALNVGASVLLDSDVPEMDGATGINIRDLIKEAPKSKMVRRSHSVVGIPHENPFLHCDDQPYRRDPMKEIREVETTKHARSPSGGARWGSCSFRPCSRRGFNNPLKQNKVLLRAAQNNVDILCLLETRVKPEKSMDIIGSKLSNWNVSVNYEFAANGRIWVLWKKNLDFTTISVSDQILSVKGSFMGNSFVISAVYGSNDDIN